jgi:hypothetical protein
MKRTATTAPRGIRLATPGYLPIWNILYTTDHELMAGWRISISTTAEIPGGVPVLPSGVGPRGGFGNHHVDITTWLACSYLVGLTTRKSLTDGENDDPDASSWVTFCKD